MYAPCSRYVQNMPLCHSRTVFLLLNGDLDGNLDPPIAWHRSISGY